MNDKITTGFREDKEKKRVGRTGLDGATDTKRKQISIDDETDTKAKKIGQGNLSLGVRIAVKAYPVKERK